MHRKEITKKFDQHAQSFDQQWSELSAINSALHLLAAAALSELPSTARVLCVGAGTGAEIIHLARAFPGWSFTAVDPSAPMLDVFRRKAEEGDILSRCVLHVGYLDSLPPENRFDAATAFLVSQFIKERALRTDFFRQIALRLRPNGLLLSSDLAGHLGTAGGRQLLDLWFKVMNRGGIPEKGIERMREAYTRDVAVLPPGEVEEIIEGGGFEPPVHFFQVGMIHAWSSERSAA